MMHDFAITDRHVVFMDLPIVFDLELALAGTMPYRWSDEYGARLGVMPRGGTNVDVRWFEITSCYVFHPLNAHEDDHGAIVLDVVRYPELWRGGSSASSATLYRWRIDLTGGRVSEQSLDDRPIEFPRCDERRIGLAHRYGYAVHTSKDPESNSGSALVKYDLRNEKSFAHEFGPGRMAAEPLFVPSSSDADEDEGWVMAYVYDASRDTSDLVILDAADFTGKPVATITLPQRVPFGFHGSWIPDAT
jgi:carotenoid cleavage dioxygenase